MIHTVIVNHENVLSTIKKEREKNTKMEKCRIFAFGLLI